MFAVVLNWNVLSPYCGLGKCSRGGFESEIRSCMLFLHEGDAGGGSHEDIVLLRLRPSDWPGNWKQPPSSHGEVP